MWSLVFEERESGKGTLVVREENGASVEHELDMFYCTVCMKRHY